MLQHFKKTPISHLLIIGPPSQSSISYHNKPYSSYQNIGKYTATIHVCMVVFNHQVLKLPTSTINFHSGLESSTIFNA